MGEIIGAQRSPSLSLSTKQFREDPLRKAKVEPPNRHKISLEVRLIKAFTSHQCCRLRLTERDEQGEHCDQCCSSLTLILRTV